MLHISGLPKPNNVESVKIPIFIIITKIDVFALNKLPINMRGDV